MRYLSLIVLGISFFFMLVSCNNEEPSIEETVLTFTLVEKENFELNDLLDHSRRSIETDDRVLFTNESIDSYNLETHEIIFKDSFYSSLVELGSRNTNESLIGGSVLLDASSYDLFRVYIDDEFIYEGYFSQSMYSSLDPPGNKMKDIDGGVQLEYDSHFIDENDKYFVQDSRNSARIISFLETKKLIVD